jgi:hypothetical protein
MSTYAYPGSVQQKARKMIEYATQQCQAALFGGGDGYEK